MGVRQGTTLRETQIILQPLAVFFGLKQQSVVVKFTFLEEVKNTSINLSCCLIKSETCSDFKDARSLEEKLTIIE